MTLAIHPMDLRRVRATLAEARDFLIANRYNAFACDCVNRFASSHTERRAAVDYLAQAVPTRNPCAEAAIGDYQSVATDRELVDAFNRAIAYAITDIDKAEASIRKPVR